MSGRDEVVSRSGATALLQAGPPAKRRGAFTLVELMIAMALLSLIIVGVFESLTRQHKTSIVTEDVVEVQNNARAISSLIEREIRMAGFMVPDAVGVCGIDNTGGPDELYVSETEPIVPDDERAADLGIRLAAAEGFTGVGATPGATNLDLDTVADLDGDGAFFYDNDADGTPESDFRVQGGFIFADLANPHRGAICGIVTAVDTTDIDIAIRAGSLAATVGTDAPTELVIVPAARYYVTTAGTTTRLMRNGDLLANGVEDFQVSYFFDNDDDGVIDSPASEEPGTGTAGSLTYDPGSWDNATLKEVRFSIVVRTRAADPDFSAGSFIQFENRGAVAGTDGFRRRAIVGTVRPRNIGTTGSI